jgi:hypothetical protein
MRKLTIPAFALLTLVGSSFAASPTTDTGDTQSRHGHTIMTFGTMYAVDGPFIGEKNAIRGVVGDELPWVIEGFVFGELDTRGRLRILVHGLVFADDPSVPPDLIGTNDEAEFRGLVSCLTEAGDTIETQNVTTAGFHANRHGDSFIHATIELPNPCVAPIIMVLAGSEDKWFAVTGFEEEEDDDDSTAE